MKSGLAWGLFLCIIRLYLVLFGGGDGGYLPLGAGQRWRTSGRSWAHQVTTMKSGLAWGSFLCIICLYWRRIGLGDGGYLPLGAGAGANVRVDQTEVGTPL